jgi:membrane associated rhomboid family serine protease
MGIYDRTYMNDGEESIGYAGRRFTAVTSLIIINVVVWLFWQFANNNPDLAEFMRRHFMCSAEGVLHEWRISTLLTSAISHIGLMHILFNLAFFYYLGIDVERVYGYRNFWWIYIFAGIASSVMYIVIERLRFGNNLMISIPMLGASGAIMGVAVIAAILDPNKPILIFGMIPMPLKWAVAMYIAIDFLGVANVGNGPDARLGTGVANAAHLGGALAGFLFYRFDLRMFSSPGRSNVGFWNSIKRIFRRKPKLRVLEREVPREMPEEAVATVERTRHAAMGSSSSGRVDAKTSQRVDELLIKISRQGMDSLTDEERTFLKQSSEKYKKPI